MGITEFRRHVDPENGYVTLVFVVRHAGCAMAAILRYDEHGKLYGGDQSWHRTTPPEWLDPERPSQKACHFVGGPCWSDCYTGTPYSIGQALIAGGKAAAFDELAKDFKSEFGFSTEIPGEQLQLAGGK